MTPVRCTRRDEILIYICQYAKQNNGITPPQRKIAEHMHLHLTTVQSHLGKLLDEGRIRMVGDDHRIAVEHSTWEEPPGLDL